MLQASEGLNTYTDATPLRLLPCDGACQKAKASIQCPPSPSPPILSCCSSHVDCRLCLFMLVSLQKFALCLLSLSDINEFEPGLHHALVCFSNTHNCHTYQMCTSHTPFTCTSSVYTITSCIKKHDWLLRRCGNSCL